LVPVCPRALRLDDACVDRLVHHILQLEHVLSRAEQFDLIHYHIDYFHFPLSRRHLTPQVTTLHGRLDIHDLVPLYQEFTELPLVSISHSQRTPLAWVNWIGTVYHGLPESLYAFNERPGDYLAFIGRISPEKRLDRAIAIAKATGIKLKIAAKIDKADREYFETEIAPLMNDPLVEYLGEIGEGEKGTFLGGARALLFPIDWAEPFGLAMIEAMACGTPVVAWRCGSVPEVVDEGVTGVIVETLEEAIAATRQIERLDRRACYETFLERFSARRMARDYVTLYQRLVEAVSSTPSEEELSGADA
jgi:glycosyltransferase involved in cell wall biosynthesis